MPLDRQSGLIRDNVSLQCEMIHDTEGLLAPL